MKSKKPGRKPVYQYGGKVESTVITVRLPNYALQKLDAMVARGIFPNRSRGIHQLIMNAEENILSQISALQKKVELLSKEIEALRKRLEIVEQEKVAVQAQAEEWERKYRELEDKLAQTFVSVNGEKEGVNEMKGEDLLKELEKLDVVELAREYYRIREALHRSPGNFYVFLGEERLKRSEAEKRLEELRSKINKVLDLKGVQRPAAWKFINRGDFDKLREVVG